MSREIKYIGMDVHKEAVVIAVLNSSGKLMMESIVETKASSILQFIHGLRGELHVTWEEGTWAAWLYDLLQPQVRRVLVCDPRRNALLKEGNKSDKVDARKLADLLRTGMLRLAPFFAMALLSPVGGWFSDRIARVSDRRTGRRVAVWVGMGIAALLLYIGSHLSVTVVALPMIALAAGFTMFAAANFWAACTDLAPDSSASLSALMNTVGNLGGVVSSAVTASVAVHQGWSRALDLAVLVTIGSGILFTRVDANHSLEETVSLW
jgi:hypothetical protein